MLYRNNNSYKSIHFEKWPEKIKLDFKDINSQLLDIAREAIGAVRKEKTNIGVSLGAEVDKVTLIVNKEIKNSLNYVIDDIKDASRAQKIVIKADSVEAIRASID